jgi:dihydropteroate synthase
VCEHRSVAEGPSLELGKTSLPLGEATYIMGVLNVSPDSKNTHTVARDLDQALVMADRYRAWGATIIDIGGQSSHYDNETIAVQEEIDRVLPAIEALAADGHLVSIDTWKPNVAREAVAAGAVIVNDTGGLRQPEMRDVVRDTGAAAVAVYVEAADPHQVGEVVISDSKAGDTAALFAVLIEELAGEGIHNVILDPGIALNYRGDYQAYTRMQLEVVVRSEALAALGKPVLIPIPRKRDFHRVAAYLTLAFEHGADMVRVHDVPLAADLARLFGRTP